MKYELSQQQNGRTFRRKIVGVVSSLLILAGGGILIAISLIAVGMPECLPNLPMYDPFICRYRSLFFLLLISIAPLLLLSSVFLILRRTHNLKFAILAVIVSSIALAASYVTFFTSLVL